MSSMRLSDTPRPYAFGFDHPEDLAFDAAGGLWSGGELGQVYRLDAGESTPVEVARLGGETRGLAFDARGDLLVCNHVLRSVVRIHPASGEVTQLPVDADGLTIRVPNYAVFGPDGSLYVSDSGSFPEADGTIWRWSADDSVEIFHHGPFAYANGLAIDAGNEWLYVVETTTDSVCRVPLAERDGPIEQYAQGLARMPDGIAFDSEGGLWVATFAGDSIYRVDSTRRTELVAYDDRAITLNRPANLAFGGEGFDQLFIANLGSTFVSVLEAGVTGQPLYGGLRGFGA
jgi:gluconolactonase